MLFRQVASPNFEMEQFVSLAASAGLTPLVLEFHGDKFVRYNPNMHALARMTFRTDPSGKASPQCLTITDIEKENGKPLHKMKTWSGRGFIPFHHELLRRHPLTSTIKLHDATDWLQARGGSAWRYCPHLFELFVEHAILFETFSLTECGKAYAAEIILPAFERVCARRDRRPLICRLGPESESTSRLLQYPATLLAQALVIANGR